MKITDLTDSYREHVIAKGDWTSYRLVLPWFFDHYFAFWSAVPGVKTEILDAKELDVRRDVVRNALTRAEGKLSGFDLHLSDVECVVMVGTGVSNGHAFLNEGRAIVWIALEGYESERQADTFVMHELLHGLHYAARPEFAFHDAEARFHFGRQLMTEGLATFLTKRILGVGEVEALWADYLTSADVERWMRTCEREWARLAGYAKDNWETSDPGEPFFQANDPADVFAYRAGYFVGSRIVDSLASAKKLTPVALLSMPRSELERDFLDTLAEQHPFLV